MIIKVTEKGLAQTVKKLSQDVKPMARAGFKRVAEIVRKAAVDEAPKKSGRLAGGIHKTPSGEMGWNIYESHKHGLWVREGTKPFGDIYPVRKRALFWPGLPHPVAAVHNHPGIRRKNLYPERAVSKSAGPVQVEMDNIGSVIAQKLGGN